MEIKPSNIFYSHDSIMYRFKKQKITSFRIFRRKTRYSKEIHLIGKTLDDLCTGRCAVSNIPKIRITKKDGKWYTLDNRRLWVFHHYEAYLNSEGKSLTITAYVEKYNPEEHDKKFTTKNGGESISVVKGSPWGVKQIKPVIPRVEEQNEEQKESGISVALEKRISETEEEEPHITVEIVDDSSISNDKNASFSKINEAGGLSTSNTITEFGFSASTDTIVSTTSCKNIAATDTTAGTTDKNSAPSDKTAVSTDEMSTTNVKTVLTTDNTSALSDNTTNNDGEISSPGYKTSNTNGEILVSTDTTANTTEKMVPAYSATVHKGDILSHTDTTTGNTDEVTTTPSTSREMLATVGTNGITMAAISAPSYTIAVSTDESSPSDEAVDASGGASAHINTIEGTTKYEISLSELAETPYGSDIVENQTRKRELPENNKQFSDDYLEVKRLKPNSE